MCLSKALTGGTIPMAITTFSQEIFDGFVSENTNHAFFHGHTFTANPTGCAAALASIHLLEQPETQQHINRIHANHIAFQNYIRSHKNVSVTRVKGIIFALEVKAAEKQAYYGALRNKLYQFFIDQGVILRPVGNTIYILPPYCISDESLHTVYQLIEKALNEVVC
jgi:adenosylmethionine-8-amino-7-oxononanoate aminotransferase